jgi:hypothetical protein
LTKDIQGYHAGGFITGGVNGPPHIINRQDLPLKGLPVAGYKPTQSVEAVELVNDGKRLQERVLRYLDKLAAAKKKFELPTPDGQTIVDSSPAYDGRAIAIARTHVEIAFTLAARAVFQPEGVRRIELPEDRFSAPGARGQ